MNTINREQLLSILKLISPALPARSIVNNAQEFFFSESNATAFNDEICIQSPFTGLFTCSIPSSELTSILSSTNEKELKFEEKESSLLFSCIDLKSEISISKNNDIAELITSLEKPKKWRVLPEDFSEALKICLSSTSEDITQGFFTAVALEKQRLISSDDLRITMVQLKAPIIGVDQILLPAKAVKNLINLTPTKIGVTDSWIHFETKENLIFSCRRILEEFPDPSDFFNIKGISIDMPKGLSGIISQILVFCERELNSQGSVDFSIAKESWIKAQNQAGRIEKKIPINYKGEPFSFSVNPNFLNELTEKCSKIVVSIEDQKALFEAKNFKHVVMLAVKE
jgi:DNA polymerase III sliding clamp (beta) subunit (PCNA family)